MRGKPKLIKRNDSPYWFIYVPQEAGQRASRLSTGETDYRQAEEVFAQWIIEGRKPELTEPDKIRISDMLDRYEDYKKDDVTVGYHMRHLRPYFGSMALSQMNNQITRDYAAFRTSQFTRLGNKYSGKKVSSATVRRELDTLSATFGFARREGYISETPFIEKPKASKPRERWLTDGELDSLIAKTDRAYLKTFLMIARHTGARPSSILELKWFQVKLEDRLIHFNPEDREQTNKHRPSVYINSLLFAHLKEMMAQKKSEYVIATTKQGKRVASIKRAFKAACERAGIDGATPYTLRHTAITKMIRQGFGLAQAGQVAGHKDPRTTMRYAKHDASFTRDVVESLANGEELAHITPQKAKNHQNGGNNNE